MTYVVKDFSPVERLLTLGRFFEKYPSGPNFLAEFISNVNLTKNGRGYFLGEFFANSP
jgi:hypothetical protein